MRAKTGVLLAWLVKWAILAVYHHAGDTIARADEVIE